MSESVKCPARAVIAKSGTCMLCHSIYLEVVKVHFFNLGLPMNRYTFVLPSENQNAFRLLSIWANAVYNVIQSLKDISSIKIFCKDIHESVKYVDTDVYNIYIPDVDELSE